MEALRGNDLRGKQQEAGNRKQDAGRRENQGGRKRKQGGMNRRVAGAGTGGKGTNKEEEPYPSRRVEKFRFCRYPYRRVWREETVG